MSRAFQESCRGTRLQSAYAGVFWSYQRVARISIMGFVSAGKCSVAESFRGRTSAGRHRVAEHSPVCRAASRHRHPGGAVIWAAGEWSGFWSCSARPHGSGWRGSGPPLRERMPPMAGSRTGGRVFSWSYDLSSNDAGVWQ